MDPVCECPYDAAYTCRFCLVREERKVAAALAAGEPPEVKAEPACFHCANSGIECDYCGTPAREEPLPEKCPTGYTWAAHEESLCNCVSRREGS